MPNLTEQKSLPAKLTVTRSTVAWSKNKILKKKHPLETILTGDCPVGDRFRLDMEVFPFLVDGCGDK